MISKQTTLIGLTTLLVTCLVTTQLVSGKVAAITLPVLGAVTYPAGTIAYAGTFFATDLTSEIFGKKTARQMVNIAFVANFLLLALVAVAIAIPAAGGVPQDQFATVLGASTNIVIASLVAYLVSQNWDINVFHFVRDKTGNSHLWARNVLSTGSSQLIDTVLFVTIAFWAAPALLGTGAQLPASIVISTIIGQYVLKLLIALFDTPLVYAAVYGFRNRVELPESNNPA
jgi:uncharacterized integral membrane protein (TIGR00697 family)